MVQARYAELSHFRQLPCITLIFQRTHSTWYTMGTTHRAGLCTTLKLQLGRPLSLPITRVAMNSHLTHSPLELSLLIWVHALTVVSCILVGGDHPRPLVNEFKKHYHHVTNQITKDSAIELAAASVNMVGGQSDLLLIEATAEYPCHFILRQGNGDGSVI